MWPWAAWYDTHSNYTGAEEGHGHRHQVDCQLELEELGNAVVDVPTPDDCSNDTGEIVVGQDDIGGFLGNIGSCDSLQENS